MEPSFWKRWQRGFWLAFDAGIVMGVAFGLPQGIGEAIAGSTEGWHRVVLLAIWIALMIVFCPVIFEALARRWMRRKWLVPPPPASEPAQPTAAP
jgi:hypothetical protein